MRAPLAALPAGALLIAAGQLLACGSSPPRPEAVVLVTLDTTRADRLGCYGRTSAETPVLDRLAREGVLFRQASSVAPITLPSHASILTGRYPASHGARNNGMYVLPEGERTLAEIFRDNGYDTAAFVGAFPLASTFGLAQGFATYDEAFHPPEIETAAAAGMYSERSAGEVNEAALAWLAGRTERPFFLWIHYFDPHAPYAAPAPFGERYIASPYDGEIAYVDAQLGALLARVAQVARPKRTVIAVAGDHGESLGEHGEAFHGLFVYEATIRSPLILHAPGRLRPGVVTDEPVSVVDLFPTLLSLAGLSGETAAGPAVQGIDLSVLAASGAGAPPERPVPILLESLLPRLEFGWSELRAIRDGKWKYVEAPLAELYDLEADPGERSNLLASGQGRDEFRRIAESLASRLSGLAETLAAQGGGGEAHRPLESETIEKLRALGYLQGGAPGAGGSPAEREADGEAPRDPKEMVDLYEGINEVGALLHRGDYDAAVAACRRHLERDPANPRVQWWYGESLLTMGRNAELEGFLEPLLAGGPAYQWVPGLMARSREGRGDIEGAIAFYRIALQKDPDYASNAVRLAGLLWSAGRYEESHREALAVLERRPGDLAALQIAAASRLRLGDTPGAIGLWSRALETAPEDPSVLLSLGSVLFQTGRFGEARPVLQKLAEVNPSSLEALRSLGAIDTLQGKPLEGIAHLREAAAIAPGDAETRYWLGLAYTRAGEFAAAEKEIQGLIRDRPGHFEGYRALGLLRREQGLAKEAEAAFRRALELNPQDAISRQSLQAPGEGTRRRSSPSGSSP